MKQHWPSIAGVPITYWEGDRVKTKDNLQRNGKRMANDDHD